MSMATMPTTQPSVEYPRVLVVAHNPFTREHSNGLTLSSLFQGWPRDRLAQIYVPFAYPIAPAFDVCHKYWSLTPFGLRSVTPSASSKEVKKDDVWPVARALSRRVKNRPNVLRVAYTMRELLYWPDVVLRGPHWREIEQFSPDIVFSSLGTLAMCRLTLEIANRLDSAIVPFFTDDWVHVDNKAPVFERQLRTLLTSKVDTILSRSGARLVISDAMAAAYEREFGLSFSAFTQVVEAGRFDPTWEQLCRIGDALKRLRNVGLDAELVVYTAAPQAAELNDVVGGAMRFGGNVPNEALPKIYEDADVLVHVESFDPKWAGYTGLSLSTKLTEYMMAGRAIVTFGPVTSNSIRYASESGAGTSITTDDDAELDRALERMISDAVHRQACATQGRRVALERHEASRERERFRSTLVEARRG
jgi:glycosyltransferase involved in cell wall biosynthesis